MSPTASQPSLDAAIAVVRKGRNARGVYKIKKARMLHDPTAWVANPNYPRDPRPLRPPPPPFDPIILHGPTNAPTLFLATLPFRSPTPPRR